MKLDNLKCIEQMQAFLSGSQAIALAVATSKDEPLCISDSETKMC